MRAFFSYCRDDSQHALQLARTLRERGVDLWVDRLDIPPGAPFRHAIDEALDTCDALLVVLTPRSVASQEVETEWNAALADRKLVLPVILEPCRVPRRLAVLQCADLSTDDGAELTRIVQALGSGASAAVSDSAAGTRVDAAAGSGTVGRDVHVSRPSARKRSRRTGAAAGLAIGAAYGSVSTFAVYVSDPRGILWQAVLAYGAVAAVMGAVAGALAGATVKALLAIATAVAVTGVVWTIVFGTYADVVITGLILGGGIVAILVAALWPRIERGRPI